jgi:hypothetical protein
MGRKTLILIAFVACAAVSAQAWGGNLTLISTGNGLIANNAATATGATAFAKDVILQGDGTEYAAHSVAHLNDGTFGNGNSWIAGSFDSWIGIKLAGATTIDAIGFGRDNTADGTIVNGGYQDGVQRYTDRTRGVYTLQYTTDSVAGVTTAADFAGLNWTTIGALTYSAGNAGPTYANPIGTITVDTTPLTDQPLYKQHLWGFDALQDVTAIRINVASESPATAPDGPICIDEFQVRSVPEPTSLAGIVGLVLCGLVAMRRRTAS